ncbi:MAG TPA: NUDIX domain-containing protein [Bdellovibrionales bacterium]|nr:NUDIX domain-containing protein [Bdellovibrionales bacterium]
MVDHIVVVAAVATDGNRYFLARRKPGSSHEGRWEFPGGKVKPGENLKLALQREIKEELNVEAKIGEPVGVGHLPNGVVIGFHTEFASKPVRSADHDRLEWFEAGDVLDLPLALGDYNIAVAALRNRLEVEALDIGSVVRLFVSLYLAIGVVAAGGLFVAQTFLRGFIPSGAMTDNPIGAAALFFIPLMYAAIGALFGLVAAGVYNLLAKLVGGVQLGLRHR